MNLMGSTIMSFTSVALLRDQSSDAAHKLPNIFFHMSTTHGRVKKFGNLRLGWRVWMDEMINDTHFNVNYLLNVCIYSQKANYMRKIHMRALCCNSLSLSLTHSLPWLHLCAREAKQIEEYTAVCIQHKMRWDGEE